MNYETQTRRIEKLAMLYSLLRTFLHGVGRQEILEQQVPQDLVKIFSHLVLLLPASL